MQAIIKPGLLRGDVAVPASKSMMQRACAAALLHKGKTTIERPGDSDDDKAALQIIQQLGAKIIRQSSSQITIQSSGRIHGAGKINCNESGLSARLFTPVAALSSQEIFIDGKGSLLHRPMQVLEDILPGLDVALNGFHGFIPFSVKGPLTAKNITIDGSSSSQFLTGILFAFTNAARTAVTVTVNHLKSKPYIDLTLKILEQFGKPIVHEGYSRFIIDPKNFRAKEEIMMRIEADWSSAAYWLAGAAINGSVRVFHLDKDSFQADKKIVEILQQAGCALQFEGDAIHVNRSELQAFDTDLTDAPDLFPVAAILAAFCRGTSRLKGWHRLIHKESNRQKSIIEMLQQFGVSCAASNDVLSITGGKELNGATINSYNDHRIVMAAAIGGLQANGTTMIDNAAAVTKSYPAFFKHLESLGVEVTV